MVRGETRVETTLAGSRNRAIAAAREITRSRPSLEMGAANVNDASRDDTRHPTSTDAASTASSSARQMRGPNGEGKASEVAARHRVPHPSPLRRGWLLVPSTRLAHHFGHGTRFAACGIRRPADVAPAGSARTCPICLDEVTS